MKNKLTVLLLFLVTILLSMVNILSVNASSKNIEIDNDILAKKDGRRYAIQTYLNKDITLDELNDAIIDKLLEHTSYVLIIANKSIDKDVKEKALSRNITLIDREDLIKVIPQE